MLMPGKIHATTSPWSEAQTFLPFFRVCRHAGALQHERQRTEDDRWTGLVDENHMLRSRGLYLLVRSRRTMSAVKTRAPVSSLLLLFRRRRLCATSILGPS